MLATLKQYQAWRTGEDGRTLDEIGLTPKKISEALDWAIDKLEGHGMTTESIFNVDELAQEIRRIDGNNSLGAGAMADALMPFIEQAVLQSPEIQALKQDERRLAFVAEDGCVFTTWVQEDCTVLYRLELSHGEEWQKEWFRSPREAIDAAMKEQQ